jgi:hypothetical protein
VLRENPALAGALIGLAIGVVKYVAVLAMIGAVVEREVKSAPADEVDFAGFGARMRPVKWMLLAVAFGVLPAVGYIAGSALGK